MKCNLSQRFEVVLDSDLIDRVGEELSGIVKPGKVMIVADEAVAGLFGGRVKHRSRRRGSRPPSSPLRREKTPRL